MKFVVRGERGLDVTLGDRLAEPEIGLTHRVEIGLGEVPRLAARERAALDEVRRSARDESEALLLFAQRIEAESQRPGFRGCPFINAAAEYVDPDSPVLQVVADHCTWYRETLAQMLGRLGVADPEEAAVEVAALRDGAMVAGHLDGPDRVRPALAASFFAVANARPQGAACSPL